MEALKNFIWRYPCLFLLLFVYLFLIPRSLSYEHAWAIPEILYLEEAALKTGPNLTWQDLGNGLNYKEFEHQVPRITRPLSSYFQILDAKFRCWLWHYILPHPSLSLTWIFTLFLTPLLLYLLLRNFGVDVNTAAGMTAFYSLTPTTLSHAAELFRPAKPMVTFAIVACLYLASVLQKNYTDLNKPIPWSRYIFFWLVSLFSLYWDETAILIVPAVLVLFPKVICSRKSYLLLWLSLPLIIVASYFLIIPYLYFLAGGGYPHLEKFSCSKNALNIKQMLSHDGLTNLILNTKNLILGTMGILPDALRSSSQWVKLSCMAAILAWGTIFFYMRKVLLQRKLLLCFLIALVLSFDYLMFIQWRSVSGPYWYGVFWSVFFTIWLALLIHGSGVKKWVFAICLFFILINMVQSFIAINTIYKKYHYYPYKTARILEYFKGQHRFFNEEDGPRFSGDMIKADIELYWINHKLGLTKTQSYCLPAELGWLVMELDPNQKPSHFVRRQLLGVHEKKDLIDTLKSSDLCNKGF